MHNEISVYFSGICGSGMKPLALLASKMKYKVYGSDILLNDLNHNCYKILNAYQIECFGHPNLEVLKNCDYYVYSSAISENHPERQFASELASKGEIQLFHRMDFLNFLLQNHENQIAVAGTHGKTSTTSMISWILMNLCLNPTIIVGGYPKFLPQGFHSGNNISVYETDESDGSFLKSNANYKIILNIDTDHLNYYQSFERLTKAFFDFSKNAMYSIINNDDLELQKFPYNVEEKFYIGFGTKKPDHNLYRYFFLGIYQGDILRINLFKNQNLIYDSKNEGIHFRFPGKHFLKNGLGAIATVYSLLLEYPGLSYRSLGNEIQNPHSMNYLIRILNRFSGVERRMDLIDNVNGIDIYDDYGHHPTEIANVLLSMKERYKNKIAVVFQPHRYSRTLSLARDFARALELADEVYLLPLYSAGESPIAGVSSELIGRFIRKKVHYLRDNEFEILFYQNYNCIVFMGAGNISYQIRTFLQKIHLLKNK
ncbi:MAG: Mur ligase family protein [Leptospiraceae bacterium]|nr:Mur ligase family protein [Leptospiraceae bacterium]MDW7976439.1 Mur ligase family protein [Leptospiraceae bacterium]